ncbi:Pyruvate dehydrogenase E1 component subunit beta-2, mitochondrial-like protein [Drosera capensis]
MSSEKIHKVVKRLRPKNKIMDSVRASIVEESFEYLDSPVERIAGADIPMPYAANVERLAVPQIEHIVRAAKKACCTAVPLAVVA